MKNFRMMGIAALAMVAVTAQAQTNLFYDGFETGTVGGANGGLDGTIWNNGFVSGAFLGPQIYDATNANGDPVYQGAKGAVVPVQTTSSGRARWWGNLSRAATAAETVVMGFWMYDFYSAAGSGNARQFLQLTDYTNDFSRTAPSALRQLIAIGNWNAGNSGAGLVPAAFNGGFIGNPGSPAVGTFYHARMTSVGAGGPGWANLANSGDGWAVIGHTPQIARTTGWHYFQVVYGPGRAEFYVDGKLAFFANHTRTDTTFDQITLAPAQGSSIPALYDEISVRAFDANKVSVKFDLRDYTGDLATVPVSVEIRDANGNVVSQTPPNTFMDSMNSVTLDAPTSAGTYTVWAKGRNWLAAAEENVSIDALGKHNLRFSLKNGDVTGDNEVGAADFSALAAAYDAVEGDANFLAAADLNGDLEVGAADFSILAANYDEVGAP